MKRYLFGIRTLSLLAMCASTGLAQVTIIDDDLNADTSSDYTVVNGGFMGGGDGTLDWAVDYGAIIDPLTGQAIPLAPGTTDGSTTGVKVSVNNTLGATEAYTIFHNTEIVGVTDYTMTVDVWMATWAIGDAGTTEHSQFGVGADNTVRNHLFQFDGACCDFSGSGHFVAISGDGADSSDYRHWRDEANMVGGPAGPVNQFNPDYLSPDMGTNVIGDNFVGFFENISNTNASVPGSIAGGWATVKVEVSQTEGRVKYYVRGWKDDTTGPPGGADPPEFLQIIDSELFDAEGYVNFGLADLYSSVSTDPDNTFAIFDNLFVEGSNLPTGGVDGDFDNNGFYECNDVDQLVSAIVDVKGGGMPDLNFDLTDDGTVNDDDLVAWRTEAGAGVVAPALTASGNPVQEGDADLDGTVDGLDFIEWNTNKFTPTAAWCAGDFNADGVVDGLDFIKWNDNKFTSADGVAAVPEPSGLWLLLIALPLTLRRRH